ncbi:tRNA lysidine(34) synthetase TilS [Rubrivirga sp.]|uniref:tRNA lysidine(34) synthetase TilS n=1 Tax=Rubrivirga sp. TaxID=1885344 RepID=UPI003C76622E
MDRALDDLGIAREEALVAAVSGGLDSVSMLHLLVQLGQRVVVATVDHGLRASSGADAEWVERLAVSLGLEVERRSVVVGEGNVQAQARHARYAALAAVARRHGSSVVATAHTATDQAETVLMAMSRGAGLRGLAGMPKARVLEDGIRLARPLLQISRSSLEAEASAKGWTWRVDPSNDSDGYQRNRVRQTVLPALRSEGGEGTDLRIAVSAESARSALEALRDGFEDAFDGSVLHIESADAQARIWIMDAIAAVRPRTVQTRALVDRIANLAEADVGQRVASSGVVVWKEHGGLRFERSSQQLGLEGGLVVEPLDTVPSEYGASPLTEVVDADRVRDLEVRAWREGDRMFPIGLEGSKLVSDLLRERGVARARRPAVPVVSLEGEIVWVVGHRLGRSVAITPATTRAERWTWSRPAG